MIWGLGHIDIGNAEEASITYVASYLQKSVKINNSTKLQNRVPEFNLMSKRLGAQWLTKDTKKFYKDALLPYIISENGQKNSMPRYYKEKLYNAHEKHMANKKVQDLPSSKMTHREETESIKHAFRKAEIHALQEREKSKIR
jgi:hypothetical protein